MGRAVPQIRQETPGGPLPFSPPRRARSERSFSEPQYDNVAMPPAGVTSNKVHKHHAKEVTAQSIALRASDPLLLCMDEALPNRQVPHPASSLRGYSAMGLDGRRVDPAAINVAAGAPRHLTAHIINSEEVPEKFNAQGAKVDDGGRVPRMTIEFVPHKKLFDPPKRDIIQHGGDRPPSKTMRRMGYGHNYSQLLTHDWNECGEKGYSPKVPLRSKSMTDLSRKNPMMKSQMFTSCKGQKRYNVCGIEDLREPATRNFIKSDVPPSARLVRENNRNELSGWEFKTVTPRVDPMMESTGMWGCLNWTTRRQYEPPEVAISAPPSTSTWLESHYTDDLSHYTDDLGTSRPDPPPPTGSEIDFQSIEAAEQRPRRMKRSSSVPTMTSRSSTVTGGESRGDSRGSRASSVSSASRSRQRNVGPPGATPAARRSSSTTSRGFDSPARPRWQI